MYFCTEGDFHLSLHPLHHSLQCTLSLPLCLMLNSKYQMRWMLLSLSGWFCLLQVCHGVQRENVNYCLCTLQSDCVMCFTAFRLWDFGVSHTADQSGKWRPADSRYCLWPQFHGDCSDHCWGCKRRPSFPPKPDDSDKAGKRPHWQCCVNSKRHWSRHFATPDYQVSAVLSHFHSPESEHVFYASEFACKYRIALKLSELYIIRKDSCWGFWGLGFFFL